MFACNFAFLFTKKSYPPTVLSISLPKPNGACRLKSLYWPGLVNLQHGVYNVIEIDREMWTCINSIHTHKDIHTETYSVLYIEREISSMYTSKLVR